MTPQQKVSETADTKNMETQFKVGDKVKALNLDQLSADVDKLIETTTGEDYKKMFAEMNEGNKWEEHQGGYIQSDNGVTAHVLMSPHADKETVDAIKKMVDLAYNMPESIEDAANNWCRNVGSSTTGVAYSGFIAGHTHRRPEIKRLHERVKELESVVTNVIDKMMLTIALNIMPDDACPYFNDVIDELQQLLNSK